MEHHIKINWTQESNFEYEENNQKISLDIVSEKGFSPKKLLLVGLAGCTGIDIVSLLEKMRVEFSEFTIGVEANLTEEHPKVYNEIEIIYSIKSEQTNQEKIQKAIDLSMQKYCGVSAMLGKTAKIKAVLHLI
ncbi:MAG: OsmC family protein [Bacteroidota bacterium]